MRRPPAYAFLYLAAIALGAAEKLLPWLRVPLPGPPYLALPMEALGLLGSIEVVWASAIAYSAYLYVKRRRLPAVLLISIFLAELLDGVLKVSFSVCRPLEPSCRPYDPLLVDSYSYPSGHSSRTFAIPLTIRRRALRWAFAALATSMAISRVLIEVHYPLDILGGASLGLASSMVARAVAGRLGVHDLNAGSG